MVTQNLLYVLGEWNCACRLEESTNCSSTQKCSRTQCKNYRGISLLSVPRKVYATVLDKRIRAITEERVLEEQGAFWRQRSCIDQLFTVRQFGEKLIEKNKTMNMVCIDLEKAFDRVYRELLWLVVERYGVKGRLKKQ